MLIDGFCVCLPAHFTWISHIEFRNAMHRYFIYNIECRLRVCALYTADVRNIECIKCSRMLIYFTSFRLFFENTQFTINNRLVVWSCVYVYCIGPYKWKIYSLLELEVIDYLCVRWEQRCSPVCIRWHWSLITDCIFINFVILPSM